MGILNRPSDGLLSVLIALGRTIIAYGPLPEDQLLALCAPPAVASQDMARKTLGRWRQLGFFHVIDGLIDVDADLKSALAADLGALRGALLRLVLAQSNNPGVDAVGQAVDDKLSRATDFTRATAWMLAQDPYTFPAGWNQVERLQNEQGVEPRVLINDTRWGGLVQWGYFLGFGWQWRKGIVPDPAFAVRTVLADVFGSRVECPQGAFFDGLASTLPVVDRGVYRVAVEKSMSHPPQQLRESDVSLSLSLALLHLETSGEIRLEARADAPQRVLIGRGGREVRPVSHIVRLRRT